MFRQKMLVTALAVAAAIALSGVCFSVEAGWYLIISKESGKVVSVDAGTMYDNAANIQQHDYLHQGVQIWIWWIEPVGSNEYKIIHRQSGKAMVVDGSTRDNDGANVKQYTYEPASPHHRWRIEDAGGGYYRIISVHSNKCLDLYQYSHAEGANIQQWQCHGGDNQLWRLDSLLDCANASEPDGSMSLAHVLGILPGELCIEGRISGDVDYFTFTVAVDCIVSISTSSREDGDTVLRLLDSTGWEMEYNDDRPGSLQSVIERCLLAGQYYVAVRGFDKNAASFDYTLSISGGGSCGN